MSDKGLSPHHVRMSLAMSAIQAADALRPCVLTQVRIHHLGDEELFRPIGTTWWSVVLGEVGFEGRFSCCAVIRARASANLFRSVENDPGGSAVCSGWA